MPARWEDVERLYHEALDLDAAVRPAYLAQACGADQELQQEVESLLENAPAGDVLLARAEWQLPAGLGADSPLQLAAGTVISSFQITGLLGEGGMGVVYKATDKKLGRSVALKMIRRKYLQDAQALARFEREAHTLASLTHAHIGAIYGLDEHGGTRFLVLEFVPGETLHQRLRRGRLEVREALLIAKQIAEALEAAHERRIVHRDLKPANIKITAKGEVKVLDFGLAKALRIQNSGALVGTSDAATLTKSMTVVGTPAYMSPEQAAGKEIDTRTDVWAFGCVLFEVLTGIAPFRGSTAPEILAGILEREPDWSLLPAGTPAEVESLLRRCLRKDSRMRLRDIGDARIELDEILAGTQRVRLPAVQSPVETPKAHRGLRLAGWAAALLVLVVIGAWLSQRRSEAPREPIAFTFTIPVNGPSMRWPAVPSPDGRRLAFVSQNPKSESSIWIRPLHATSAFQVAETEGAFDPFWSPDGSSIGFLSQGKLKRVSASGGPAQTICSAGTGLGAAWSSSGDVIFAPWNRTVLHKVAAGGGVPVPITTLDLSRQENSHRWPEFLPDGRHFLFTARSSVKENTAIYAGSLDSKDIKRLMTAQSNAVFARPGYLLFAREGTLMAQVFDPEKLQLSGEPFPIAGNIEHSTESCFGSFAVSGDGRVISYQDAMEQNAQLTWYDRSGRALGTVGAVGRLMTQPRISPDGKRVAVVKADSESGNRDIWVVELQTGAATRFTHDAANDWMPVWSRDGRTIYFASDRLGQSSIFRKAVDGGEEQLVLAQGATGVFPSDLSPDGKLLLYHMDHPKNLPDIWVDPLQAGGKPSPWLATEAIEMEGIFSPDGKYVAYSSNDAGDVDVYARSFAGGDKHRVSLGGGRFNVWRGNELFYAAPDDTIMAVKVKPGDSWKAAAPQPLFRGCPASHTSRSTVSFFDVSADGQRFLLNCLAAGKRERSMTVLVNWQR